MKNLIPDRKTLLAASAFLLLSVGLFAHEGGNPGGANPGAEGSVNSSKDNSQANQGHESSSGKGNSGDIQDQKTKGHSGGNDKSSHPTSGKRHSKDLSSVKPQSTPKAVQMKKTPGGTKTPGPSMQSTEDFFFPLPQKTKTPTPQPK